MKDLRLAKKVKREAKQGNKAGVKAPKGRGQ
jgi:hypothetical protein